MSRVLVIEDEAVLRASVARGLGKVAAVEVDQAGTLDEAVAALDRNAPDVIVSDIDLPGRSGLELLGELGRRGLHVPIVFVTGYLKAFAPQIPRHANVDVLEKPVEFEQLRDVVLDRLRPSAEVALSPFSVPDYLQLACVGGHSIIVRVETGGEPEGEVVVKGGELWGAQDQQGDGMEALRRMMFADNATVHCSSLPPGHTGHRNLEGTWEALLMEAARLNDEEQAGRQSEPDDEWSDFDDSFGPASTDDTSRPATESAGALRGFDTVRPPPSAGAPESEPPPDPSFERHWEAAVQALLAKEYEEARREFLAARAAKPDDPKVIANLKRLEELGYGDE